MFMRCGRIFALLLTLSLGACVTPIPTHVALAPKAKEAIASTEVVTPIQQSEVYIFVPPTTAGQAHGLIGALIDSGVDAYRAGTAEKAVKPLRDTVVDANFDAALQTQLKTSLSQVTWLHAEGFRVMKETARDKLDLSISGSKNAAVLITYADYHLSNDGAEFSINVKVELFANDSALASFKPAGGHDDIKSDPSNALYRDSFTFKVNAPGAGPKRDLNMAAWSASNGEAFRAAMKTGVVKICDMIAMDLQDAPPDLQGTTDPAGSWVRLADGGMVFTAR